MSAQEPDVTKKRKKRRSARFYISTAHPLPTPEQIAALATLFPPDDPGDDDGPTPAHSEARARTRAMARPDTGKRDYSQSQRRRMAREGNALPSGAYPIADSEDLENAATLARTGHGDVKAARKLIARRAKELGVANPLDSSEKSYLGEALPGDTYASRRVSEPLTAGHASPAVDDHGVGQGRNPGLAAHHGDLRQSSPAAFDAVIRLMTVNAEGNGDRGITWYGGEAALRMFDARGQAGTYGGMQAVDPSPQRPDWHIARNSATPPNGSHSTANANRPPVQSMKASDRVRIMREHMFPGSGGAR